MSTNQESQFILLGSPKRLFIEPSSPRIILCRDRSELQAAMPNPSRRVTCIAFTSAIIETLLEVVLDNPSRFRDAHLITLKPPRTESISALLGLFHPVFGLIDGFRWLAAEELIEVVTRDDADERFLGASVDLKAQVLTLVRGDMKAMVVPFDQFPTSGDGIEPDFAKLKLTDYGRTIALGPYEASSDAILYELDADYRRKLNAQRRRSERTFGASLMRLRKQRRLKRTDFAPISSKEIARIERNEVEKPHAKTLEVIASQLGLRPEEIEGF